MGKRTSADGNHIRSEHIKIACVRAAAAAAAAACNECTCHMRWVPRPWACAMAKQMRAFRRTRFLQCMQNVHKCLSCISVPDRGNKRLTRFARGHECRINIESWTGASHAVTTRIRRKLMFQLFECVYEFVCVCVRACKFDNGNSKNVKTCQCSAGWTDHHSTRKPWKNWKAEVEISFNFAGFKMQLHLEFLHVAPACVKCQTRCSCVRAIHVQFNSLNVVAQQPSMQSAYKFANDICS